MSLKNTCMEDMGKQGSNWGDKSIAKVYTKVQASYLTQKTPRCK